METRNTRITLVAVVAALVIAACEIQSTDRWLPEPIAAQPSASAVADAGTGAAMRVRPQVVPLWRAGDTVPYAVAVAIDAQRLWLTPGDAADQELNAGRDLHSAVAVSAVVRLPSYRVLAARTAGAWPVTARAATPRVGDRLLRVAGRDGAGLETLQVIDVRGDTVETTCPRVAAGPVFAAATGAWLPAVWLPDPAGACPRLHVIDIN